MPYDEIFDGETIRPLYRDSYRRFSEMSFVDRRRVDRGTRACIHGDADFLPLARLMRASEYEQICVGVRQRGRALRLFLEDHFFGERSYSKVISRAQVARIQSRYPSAALPRRENLQFWYGPDIIRDESGSFRVIEDNIGFVGGMGDLEALANSLEVLGAPLPRPRHPRKFYEAMVAGYRSEARSNGHGKTVLLAYPKASRLNHEDARFEKIVGELGVESVTNFRHLSVRPEGLYHRGERVGFVILYVSAEDVSVSGFWQAADDGLFGLSNSPAFEFVSDKSFCPFVEKLVEFYLREPCVLPTLPTLQLSRGLSRVAREREKWVIKLSRGQSGESVWVGAHLTPRRWDTLLARVARHPADFIAQRFCEPSHFLGHAVDLRPLAVISSRGELVSAIPWARAAATSRSKTNIACGGLLAPVAIVGRR